MGGLGSGSSKRSSRLSTQEVESIDIRDVAATGVFARLENVQRAGNCPLPVLKMVATTDGTIVSLSRGSPSFDDELDRARHGERLVAMVATEPPFGGRRYWFVCPRPWCRRRCR